MTFYYLSPYRGTGSTTEPFTPVLVGDGWASIDLRPDPANVSGVALVAMAEQASTVPAGVIELGDGSALSTPRRNGLANRLGLSLSATTLPEIVAELLLEHADKPGRWRGLSPRQDKQTLRYRYEIHLGGLLWQRELPIIAGGATATDDFNRANSTTIGGSWVEDLGDWSIANNALTSAGTNDAEIRNTTTMATADQYAQVTAGNNSFRAVGAFVRRPAAATRTHYVAQIYNNNSREFFKRVNGTATSMAANVTSTVTIPGTIRVEAQGSTIRAMWNGTPYATVTDTSIATNPHTGIFMFNGGNAATADNFSAGDIGVPTVPVAATRATSWNQRELVASGRETSWNVLYEAPTIPGYATGYTTGYGANTAVPVAATRATAWQVIGRLVVQAEA